MKSLTARMKALPGERSPDHKADPCNFDHHHSPATGAHEAFLKGLRHDDFAVLGQFCVKIINYCLYTYTKCS